MPNRSHIPEPQSAIWLPHGSGPDDIMHPRSLSVKRESWLIGSAGRDVFYGGPGADILNARHDDRDARIYGGPGSDLAKVDPVDPVILPGVERVERR